MFRRTLISLGLYLSLITISFLAGFMYYKLITKPEIVIKEISTTIFRFPSTPPFTSFPDPINFKQALLLLEGMRASHVGTGFLTFDRDPGYGIADEKFQKLAIKWYDQLIDFAWRQEHRINDYERQKGIREVVEWFEKRFSHAENMEFENEWQTFKEGLGTVQSKLKE